MNRTLSSCALHLLAFALLLGGLTACNRDSKSESAKNAEAPLAPPPETPPPPEPASPLGTASGTLQMVDFADQTEFLDYDRDHSAASLAKAQGTVSEEFHSAIAEWKLGSHTLVIRLYPQSFSADEAAQIKGFILTDSDALRKRAAISGQVASITVTFASTPPATGNQTAHIVISSRGTNGRFYSATGPADVNVNILPIKESWAKPGRILPGVELRTSGKTHYGGSSFGSAEWQIETRVPVIINSGY